MQAENNFKRKNARQQTVFEEEKVAEIRKDFAARSAARRAFEAQWQVNCNFVAGNQYVYAKGDGSVLWEDRDYFWQERECFNHIAPIIETRLAKLQRVRPKMSVRPASGDEDDRPPQALASLVQAGRLGMKSGSGFYDGYDQEGGNLTVGKLKKEN